MAWFDAFAKGYDDWYERKLGRYVDRIQKGMIASLAEPKQGEEALDVGAGTGNYTLWLAEKGVHATGIDPSREMLALAKEKASAGNVEWVQGDAHALPFADETFHLVIAVTSLEFMEDPRRVLEEALRVLKPGGRIVAGLLAKESPWGDLYTRMAEDDRNLFAKAHLYREEEIEALIPGKGYTLLKGLYLPPVDSFDEEAALEEERRLAKENAPQAGFYAVRWVKNAKK